MSNTPPSNGEDNTPKKADLLSTVLKLKTPIQLVGFFLVVISSFWIKELHGLNTKNGLILIILTVVLVLAVVFLFFVTEIPEGGRLSLLLVIYIGIIAFLFYLVHLFTTDPTPGDKYYTIKIRDSLGGNIENFEHINILRSKGMNTDNGVKDNDHSQVSFQVTAAKPWHLTFQLSTKNFRFPNGKLEWSVITSADDTTITLKKIAVVDTIIPPNKPKNTFFISDGYLSHVEELQGIIRSINHNLSPAEQSNSETVFRISCSNGPKKDVITGYWIFPGGSLTLKINNKSYNMGFIAASAPDPIRSHIEDYIEQKTLNIAKSYDWKKHLPN